MEQIISEGERASVDENIFRYYSTNEESLKQKIAELDTKIQEAMAENTNLFPSDIKSLENQIDEKLEDISKQTDATKLEEYKKEIDNLIAKKAKIAGESSPQGSYLRQLIEERKNYESELNSGATFLELYEAFMANKKIYLYNDIPEGMLYDEISGFSPIVINGDLSLVK